jgi:hypothetical protein
MSDLFDAGQNGISGATSTWDLILTAATGPIRAGMHRAGLGEEWEDALQEFSVYLIRLDGRRLRGFRGSTLGELRAFIRVVSRRFAARYVRRSLATRRLEDQALAGLAPSDRSGPTESQIITARRRIQSAMSDEEQHQLQAVSGLDESFRSVDVPSVCDRTIRRWRNELVRKYCPVLFDCMDYGGGGTSPATLS